MDKKTENQTQYQYFEKCLKHGQEGEDLHAKYYASCRNGKKVINIGSTPRGKSEGIDLEIYYADGHIVDVDVKTDDKTHKTGNVVYEEWAHGKPGCFVTTKSKYIVYFVYYTGETYVLHPDRFTTLIQYMKQHPKEARKYGIKKKMMGDDGYGYVVPVKYLLSKTDICKVAYNLYDKVEMPKDAKEYRKGIQAA